MNYINKLAVLIGKRCDTKFEGEYTKLLRIYALLCLAKGAETTNEDVHDAWSAWRAETDPNHKSLIPFKDLEEDVQKLDTPYRDAIRKVALETKPYKMVNEGGTLMLRAEEPPPDPQSPSLADFAEWLVDNYGMSGDGITVSRAVHEFRRSYR